jgi:virginiamycin B lyase
MPVAALRICCLAVLLAGLAVWSPPVAAQSQPALAGQVSSAEEGAMEGVVVSARKEGGTVTVSVVSDDKGQFRFPAAKLAPGRYALAIRAVGYDLKAPVAVEIAAGKTVGADLALVKTRNLAGQLTNAEWMLSMPGSDEQKKFLLNCNSCHTFERIAKSTHDAAEWAAVIQRMGGYYPGATPLHPQRLPGQERDRTRGSDLKPITDFMASLNLSGSDKWSYDLETLPRLKGASTRIVVTEYALPRPTIEPHDVMVDGDGMVWFTNFGELFLGRMDPRTGAVKEYPIPELKKGSPTGMLDLEVGPDGNLWTALMFQAAIARFDKKTEQFRLYPIPAEWQSKSTQQTFVTPTASQVDGKVWVKNSDGDHMLRLDQATGAWEDLGQFHDAKGKRVWGYAIPADSHNNLYMLDFSAAHVGKIDAKTKQLTVYPTPNPNSRPRRGRTDAQDRVWFAEYGANAIGVLDTKAEKIREWQLATPWNSPYDVVLDKNEEAWTGGMQTDRITRIDTKTNRIIEYQLPHATNIRRVFVDNSTSPVTLWAGSNHGASIVKLEPLE